MSLDLYPPVRAQSVSEVLDTAFQIFAASLLKSLPYGILLTLSGQLENIFNLATGRPLGRFAHRDPAAWCVYALTVIVSLALWAALILRQRALAEGARANMRLELSAAVKALPTLVVLTLLSVLATALGALLLVFPALYLLVALIAAGPAVVLDHQGPLAAMRYSLRVVRGRWWRTLAIELVTIAIVFVFYILALTLAAIAVPFARGADVAVVTATSTVLIICLGAFSVPFLVAMMLAVFGDLQARQRAPDATA